MSFAFDPPRSYRPACRYLTLPLPSSKKRVLTFTGGPPHLPASLMPPQASFAGRVIVAPGLVSPSVLLTAFFRALHPAVAYIDGSAPPRQYGIELPKSATVG